MKTALWEWHKEHGAKLAPFASYEMPIQYKGVIEEHRCVRNHVGLFDVSHMGVAIIEGSIARSFLNRALTRDISKLQPGHAAYSILCYENGNSVDDLIVYCKSDSEFWLVLNASNKHKDIRHLNSLPGATEVKMNCLFEDLSLFALQGPKSLELLAKLGLDLQDYKAFGFGEWMIDQISCHIAFTGYTGEKGCEIFVPVEYSKHIWELLIREGASFGIQPIGLAARDTLRLEMGYSLYGHELSDSINPIEAGLKWAVDLEKDFVGRNALQNAFQNKTRKIVALKKEGKQAPRAEMRVFDESGKDVGFISSGSYSPSLDCAIGLALVDAQANSPFFVDIRGQKVPFETTKRPFYQAKKL